MVTKQPRLPLSKLSAHKCCLSQASSDWVKTVYDPESGPLVGIPDGSVFYTRKARTWVRGTISTANGTPTNDLGILFNPNGLMVSDQYTLLLNSPSTANTLPAVNSAGLFYSNAPFTTADVINHDVQCRIVAAGLKLRYLGTSLNQGGLVYSLQEPTHGSLASKTTAQMAAYTECQKQRVIDLRPGEWHTLVRTLGDESDLSFIDSVTRTNAYDATYSSDGVVIAWDAYPYMAAYVQAPTALSNYEYEAWGVVEYSGPKANPKTLTIPDPYGLKIAQASMSSINANAKSTESTAPPAVREQRVQVKASEILDKSLPYFDQAVNAFSRYGPSVAAAASQGYKTLQAIRGAMGGSRGGTMTRTVNMDILD